MAYPVSHFALLSTLLAIGAASDLAQRRISNHVAVSVAVAGFASQAAVGGIRGAASGLGAAVLVGALLWPVWARRMIGGGDLKLGAAAAAWVGLAGTARYLLSAAVATGALACFAYAASSWRARSEMRSNLLSLALGTSVVGVPLTADRGRVVVPAGAAFAVGALFALVTGGMS